MRTFTLLAGGALVLASGVACSIRYCPYGIAPFDGATDVGTDVVVEIRASAAFPADLPALIDAVGLATADGEPVEVDIEVDRELGLVRLIPREGLRPDTTYEAWGVDEQLARGMHWSGWLVDEQVRATFHTGAAPGLIAALADDETVVLVFSEAVQRDTLEGRVQIEGDDGVVVEPVVVGDWEGEGHLVELLLPEEVAWPADVVFSDGILSESGLTVFSDGAAQPLQGPEESLERDLRAYSGLARCGEA